MTCRCYPCAAELPGQHAGLCRGCSRARCSGRNGYPCRRGEAPTRVYSAPKAPSARPTRAELPAGPRTYREFRTGLTFGEVRRMLWVDNPDPKTWRQKSRGCVLGFWHGLKLAMWDEYAQRHPMLSRGLEAVSRTIENRGRRMRVWYWRRARTPRPHPAGCVPVRKTIQHRGRTFDVTYWVREDRKAA